MPRKDKVFHFHKKNKNKSSNINLSPQNMAKNTKSTLMGYVQKISHTEDARINHSLSLFYHIQTYAIWNACYDGFFLLW